MTVNARADIDQSALEELESSLATSPALREAEVLGPADPGYDQARSGVEGGPIGSKSVGKVVLTLLVLLLGFLAGITVATVGGEDVRASAEARGQTEVSSGQTPTGSQLITVTKQGQNSLTCTSSSVEVLEQPVFVVYRDQSKGPFDMISCTPVASGGGNVGLGLFF